MKLFNLLVVLHVLLTRWPLLVTSQNTEVCVGLSDQFVIDPLSCDHYYACVNGIGTLLECFPGSWFDFNSQWCIDSSFVDCHLLASTTPPPVTPTRDPNIPDEIFCPATDNPLSMQFLPSLVDCERYYICYHGQPNPLRCLEGFYWNQAMQMCDYPINANCPLNPTPIDSICSRSASGQASIVPHPTECELYYFCVNGVPQVQQCPFLFHFDYQSQQCLARNVARCFVNRTL